MSANISTFISSFRGGARANRFRIGITWPGAVGTPNVRDEIVCMAASMPASQLGVVQVPYKGRLIPIPGDRTFSEWSATFINDITFSHRNAFERWSNLILSHEGNLQSDNYKNFTATIDVVQLDRDDRILKTIKLHNAFPMDVSQIELSYEAMDQIEYFQTAFAYSHWTSVNSPTT